MPNKIIHWLLVIICAAPLCGKKVELTHEEKNKSVRDNGRIVGLCPEHLERITAGRISDHDPNTNQDLNRPGE